MKSDAFATGQTLYVLSLAGYTTERAELKRGIDFLVATQMPDGSWPMTSRSTPDGSPGRSKLLTPITCAASSWATLGLTRLAPKIKQKDGRKVGFSGVSLRGVHTPRIYDAAAYAVEHVGTHEPCCGQGTQRDFDDKCSGMRPV